MDLATPYRKSSDVKTTEQCSAFFVAMQECVNEKGITHELCG
jgi:hypothetical protein